MGDNPRMKRPWHILVLLLAVTEARADDVKASLDEKGLVVRLLDDAFKFELGGRYHGDLGAGGSRQIIGEFPDPAQTRRLWIEPTITINKDLIFDLQYD